MDASRVFYAYGEEATYATPPNSVAYQKIRYTGGNGWTPSDTLSDSGEVNATLMRSRPAITQRAADGGVDFEFSDSKQFKDWLAMVMTADGASMAAAWSTAATLAASTINVVLVGSDWTFQAADPALDGINTLKVGQYITTTGFTNAANNGTFRVKAVDFGVDPQIITVEETLTAETGDADERISISSMVRNGTTRHSLTVIDGRPGVNTFQSFHGQVADSLSFTAQANAFLTGSVGFIGAGYSSSDTDLTNGANTLGYNGAAITGASYTAAESTSPMITSENIQVHENGTLNGGMSCTRGFDINISGRARAQQCLGHMYNSGVGLNIFYPELNLTYYFTEKALLDKYFEMGSTVGYVERLSVSDPSGNTYIFTFPAVFLSGWSLTAGSLDADMEASFGASKAYNYTDSEGVSYAMQVDYIAGNVFA